jgi:hypothetical protein
MVPVGRTIPDVLDGIPLVAGKVLKRRHLPAPSQSKSDGCPHPSSLIYGTHSLGLMSLVLRDG